MTGFTSGEPPLSEAAGLDYRAAADGADEPTEATTGTTTVGIVAEDAVVFATDRRASLGGRFVANKDVEKVEQVHPTGAVTISGSVGALQGFVRSLDAQGRLYETRRGEPMSADALSQAAADMLRGLPAQILLGAVDDTGPHLYELDGGGSRMEDDYAATGSGMQLAYGTLEDAMTAEPSVEEARDLAEAAIRAASERDTASGNGVVIATVTSEGVEMEGTD